MSVINLLFRQSPKLAGYEFDAVLEDTIDASIQLTRYPVESGAMVNDHRIINPIKYYLTGAVSNNPIKPILTDFVGLATEIDSNNPYIATIAGLSIGFLSGSNETRASSALQFLIDLMVVGLPFDVDTVDANLANMVITRISRTSNAQNENGLIFIAELQELITLDRLPDILQPSQVQLPDGDPCKSAAAADVKSGQRVGSDPSAAQTTAIEQVLQYGGVDI
ncbi:MULTISPECIES: phage baseplate protein [unclassified Methylophaga]|jgi:hypothetical protein|uniref:phage baseplate protein n=1 Tax=unclassified Methylophaga TaxID=2629249 RepID=UPI00259CCF9F|nr:MULTISPECIES: hypothetical protein [unclassified Methylophaga]|tara:strand:- start:12222 stop:12887 length:666 start_codon:yes stop_codon:yes gene_type:complete